MGADGQASVRGVRWADGGAGCRHWLSLPESQQYVMTLLSNARKGRPILDVVTHGAAALQPPPWRQPRGKSMVSLVNSHTTATRIGWHLWEIDLRSLVTSRVALLERETLVNL